MARVVDCRGGPHLFLHPVRGCPGDPVFFFPWRPHGVTEVELLDARLFIVDDRRGACWDPAGHPVGHVVADGFSLFDEPRNARSS